MNNTSHYGECLTLMRKYERRHLKRLIVLAIFLCMNFYAHALTFGVKYAGESFQSAMVVNAERNMRMQPVSVNIGVFAIFFMFISVGIGILIFKKARSNKIKIGYLISIVMFLGIYMFTKQSQNVAAYKAEGRMGVSHLAFGMGMLTLIFSLACLVLALLGDHKHPKLCFSLIILLVIGGVTDCYHWLIASLMVLMYLLSIPEYQKMKWILKQPGYPYFNERFDEQLRNQEFNSPHKLDGKIFASMEDVEGSTPCTDPAAAEAAYAQQQQEMKDPVAVYTVRMGSSPDEMPGIDDIMEPPPEPLPEPELPNAEDIPAPVWNIQDVPSDIPDTKWDVPDPTWDVPDPVTDTSAILSDFPEVAGDIPDLPDLPDIPQI